MENERASFCLQVYLLDKGKLKLLENGVKGYVRSVRKKLLVESA